MIYFAPAAEPGGERALPGRAEGEFPSTVGRRAMRPAPISDEYIGQKHILGPGPNCSAAPSKPNRIQSLIFLRPRPARGKKTSLAPNHSARQTESKIPRRLSGRGKSNVADMAPCFGAALRTVSKTPANRTILFHRNEIHRFNKSQQGRSPARCRKSGVIRLIIGATTHNPFFFVNSPLVSRSQIFELRPASKKTDLLETPASRPSRTTETRGLGAT